MIFIRSFCTALIMRHVSRLTRLSHNFSLHVWFHRVHTNMRQFAIYINTGSHVEKNREGGRLIVMRCRLLVPETVIPVGAAWRESSARVAAISVFHHGRHLWALFAHAPATWCLPGCYLFVRTCRQYDSRRHRCERLMLTQLASRFGRHRKQWRATEKARLMQYAASSGWTGMR